MSVRTNKLVAVFVATLVGFVLAAPAADAGAPLTPLTGVVQVEVGRQMGCAVMGDTTARCWGLGPLGTGGSFSETSRSAVVVEDAAGDPMTGVAQIVVGGGRFVCVRLVGGTAQCWGDNMTAVLGDGTTTSSLTPVAVQRPGGGGPLTDVASLTAGDGHVCALLTNGQARCWGQNSGALGDGTTTDRPRPVAVRNGAGTGPLTGITQIVAGAMHTCALLTNATVRCWGDNGVSQVGDGTTTSRLLPRTVKAHTGSGALSNVVQLSTQTRNTCARTTAGQLRCWGPNRNGELGTGSVTPVSQPTPLLPRIVVPPTGTGALSSVRRVGVGSSHSCARVGSTGEARCWGSNSQGQAGDGTVTTPRPRPRVVRNVANTGPLTGVVDVSSADQHSCALLSDTTVACWGANGVGEVGDGTNAPRRTTPRLVVG